MSSILRNATIRIRRDTAGNWTSNDPTPAEGEICLETDTGYLKVGDGATAWTALVYIFDSMPSFSVTGSATALSGITVPVMHVQDQKASATEGGTFTSGAWRTRVLNTTITNTITGASLAANQITLPAGTYKIDAKCQVYAVNGHKAKIYNITDASDILLGVNQHSAAAAVVGGQGVVSGTFTIAGTKVIELQHQCQTTYATYGFGTPSGWGTEVYADVFIEKLA